MLNININILFKQYTSASLARKKFASPYDKQI